MGARMYVRDDADDADDDDFDSRDNGDDDADDEMMMRMARMTLTMPTISKMIITMVELKIMVTRMT